MYKGKGWYDSDGILIHSPGAPTDIWINSSQEWDYGFNNGVVSDEFVPAHKLIKAERFKQEIKYGYTLEWILQNEHYYKNDQFITAATKLLKYKENQTSHDFQTEAPLLWDQQWWNHICNHPHEERLIIAASFIAAHYDYLKSKT